MANRDPREGKLSNLLNKLTPVRVDLTLKLVSVKKYNRAIRVGGEILDQPCLALQLQTASGDQVEVTLDSLSSQQVIRDAILDSDQLYSIFKKNSLKPVDG
jgi:hypothetical protein